MVHEGTMRAHRPEGYRGVMQRWHSSSSISVCAPNEQKASNPVFPLHIIKLGCYENRGEAVVPKRKAASLRHLFTCTSNRRKIENVKIALRLFRPPLMYARN